MSKKKLLVKIFILGSLIFPLRLSFAQTEKCAPPLVADKGGKCISPSAPVFKYDFLAPISDTKTFDSGVENALGTYLNLAIHIFIGLCAVFAVVMIVIGGIEYMTTELISGKEDGKKRIKEALLGLLLALFAYALLYTINPNLLNTDFNPNEIKIKAPINDLTDTSANAQPAKPAK